MNYLTVKNFQKIFKPNVIGQISLMSTTKSKSLSLSICEPNKSIRLNQPFQNPTQIKTQSQLYIPSKQTEKKTEKKTHDKYESSGYKIYHDCYLSDKLIG
jgi:hypothetical protein